MEPGKQWPGNMELLLSPGVEGQEQQGVFGAGGGVLGNGNVNGGGGGSLFAVGESGAM